MYINRGPTMPTHMHSRTHEWGIASCISLCRTFERFEEVEGPQGAEEAVHVPLPRAVAGVPRRKKKRRSET